MDKSISSKYGLMIAGDMPYIRLIKHNQFVFENISKLINMRGHMALGDFGDAVEILYSFTKEELEALWIAPTGGGWLKTEEIATIKTDPEWIKARDAYFAAKQEEK